MSNKSTIQALQEQTLPMNLIGLLSSQSYYVENPIHEIQEIYGVTTEVAQEIYETVGEDYPTERMVAALCCISTPEYIAKLRGGVK
ncbi:hypothetical protein [Sphingobacterium hotanense]|uniref:Uncharacterized protein n=1 Tax=Sphingobacterium hotanense TaxID=649196 RepID=A0ABT7NQG1_9SPHI|nr:hypothetical protein [Sphingobacterium hotanense]MDM1049366.1 hypothetical protein [Sphingobacterium hotanense]